jgi:hypothetical protein
MAASSFDPFDLEKPMLRLGAHGEYVVGDLTKTRKAAIDAIIERVQDVDDADTDALVSAYADLAEACCESSEGLADKIRELYATEQLGMIAINGLAEFLNQWYLGEASVGEG